MLDLNNEEQQQTRAQGPIPAGSVVKVRLAVRKPKYPSPNDPMVARTQTGLLQLDTEFEVISGTYEGLKIWDFTTLPAVAQTIQLSDGQRTACSISGRRIRAMVEAAKGIDPKDDSDKAKRGRTLHSLMDLNGMEFPLVVGISKEPSEGRNGRTYWNNTVGRIVTPNGKEYVEVMHGGEVITDGPVTGEGGNTQPRRNQNDDDTWEAPPASAYNDDVQF